MKNKLFIWVVQEVFILYEPCCFSGVEGPDIHFHFMVLMRSKNLLHFIKERQTFITIY
jgi:hypothetical protein